MARKKGGHDGGGGGHDAAGGMRWLLTYSDLVTLLLILFIMLYSMSKIDAAKFKELAQLLHAAFGGVLTQGPTFLQGNGERIIPDLVPRLAAALGPTGETGGAKVFRNERGIVIRLMTDNVLFDMGQAGLKPEMKAILDALAGPLREAGRPIAVEGHTDNLPVRGGGRYASNWELSSERATEVVRYLVEKGRVPPASLSAAGYAEFHPVVPNTSGTSRARNRRIDIIILDGVTPSTSAKPSAPPVPQPPAATTPAAPPIPSAPPVPSAPPAPPLPGGN